MILKNEKAFHLSYFSYVCYLPSSKSESFEVKCHQIRASFFITVLGNVRADKNVNMYGHCGHYLEKLK